VDYNSLGGLGTWAAYTGMTEIMSKMTGPINNMTFKQAVAKTTNLDTHGMVPVVNFTKPWTAFPRSTACSIARSYSARSRTQGRTADYRLRGREQPGPRQAIAPAVRSGSGSSAGRPGAGRTVSNYRIWSEVQQDVKACRVWKR